MITVDLLAHGFPREYAQAIPDTNRDHYRAFVSKTVAFIALELRKRYSKPQILLTPGNNDDDCGDYNIEAEGPFLSYVAWTIWPLAGPAADSRGNGSRLAVTPSSRGIFRPAYRLRELGVFL